MAGETEELNFNDVYFTLKQPHVASVRRVRDLVRSPSVHGVERRACPAVQIHSFLPPAHFSFWLNVRSQVCVRKLGVLCRRGQFS